MIAYKAFNKNMMCYGDFQFKENEEFIHKGFVSLNHAGFHFCCKLEDCFHHYDKNNCVIHLVEVPDYVKEFNNELMDGWVTNRIRILDRVYESPEYGILSEEEAQQLLQSDDWANRVKVAEHGYFLDTLYKDPTWVVRQAVARQGSHLDDLYLDPNCLVRAEVANQGSHLDDLYMDREAIVRCMVAEQGSHLDDLEDDPYTEVKMRVEHSRKIEPYVIK